MEQDPKLSIRRAAAHYNVSPVTLCRRRKGTLSRRDSYPSSANLTKLEENVIIEKILDLDSRLCAPRISGIKEIANFLLAARGAKPVETLGLSRIT